MFQCSTKQHMNFDSKTRLIFFNGAIEKSDESLIEFYKKSKHLSLDPPPEGNSIYPPLSALRQEYPSEKYIFRFRTHPYVSFKFREGELMISKLNNNYKKVFSSPFLKFIFDSKEQSEIAFSELINTYSKLSTRKRFSSDDSTKNAEFTDDNSKSIQEIGFEAGKGDVLANGYVIIIGPGNDIDL